MGLDPQTIFSPFDLDQHRKLVIAVSGGSDSLGLLFMTADLIGDADRLLAVTVDHGLRAESAEEARVVAALCARHGIRHRTMAWQGEKPRSGLIAAAREARYELLAEAAVDFGADTVLVAHTMDDQAETVAMRAQRRDQGSGLAGMADATLFDGKLWILRPLLGVRRRAIRDFLGRCEIKWIDDPSNDNRAFERVRTRSELSDAEIEALAMRARQEGGARSALADAAARFMDRFATRPSRGLFRLDPAILQVLAEDRAAAVHALRALLAVVGGIPHLPDVARAEMLFSRLGEEEATRATLSRAVVDARRSGIWIRREARALPTLELSGRPTLWDGRWCVSTAGKAGVSTVAPLGAELAKEFAVAHAKAPESLTRAALSLEPALFWEGKFVALAENCKMEASGALARPAVAPFARFLPGFDLALAEALARLAGAPPFPPAPWKHHIATGP